MALAEFERELIRERTMAGFEAARSRGRKGRQEVRADAPWPASTRKAPAAARQVLADVGQKLARRPAVVHHGPRREPSDLLQVPATAVGFSRRGRSRSASVANEGLRHSRVAGPLTGPRILRVPAPDERGQRPPDPDWAARSTSAAASGVSSGRGVASTFAAASVRPAAARCSSAAVQWSAGSGAPSSKSARRPPHRSRRRSRSGCGCWSGRPAGTAPTVFSFNEDRAGNSPCVQPRRSRCAAGNRAKVAVGASATTLQRKDRELRRSRDEVEQLAALAERERIGRDLHDLLAGTPCRSSC